jgi:stage II sporulation protein D
VRALALSLLLTLLLAAPAAASVKWVVRGGGFGHGVGMSQYGAYGYAVHGKGYRFILRHYYQGTTIGELSKTRLVRVLLRIDPGDVSFTKATSACGRTLSPDRVYVAHLNGSSIRLRSSTGKLLTGCGRQLRAAGDGRVRIGGLGPYRGALEIVPTKSDPGSLNVINAVAINAYVKGVVPHEVSYLWPQAALRAQAVAARSFGLSAKVGGNGFDLYADGRSQAYIGLGGETRQTNRACAATRNEVVKYRGVIATTFYYSTSGGETESVENVFFSDPIPYLRAVRDPYDYYSPLHRWTLSFSAAEMNSRLGGYLRGRLKRIVVTKRGVSPRVVWARLYGTGGMTKIRGDSLQYALGGYDRWMYFKKVVRRSARTVNRRDTAGSGSRDRSPAFRTRMRPLRAG